MSDPKPPNLNLRRVAKLSEEKQQAQQAFDQLLVVLRHQQDSQELIEHFSLKCLACTDLESLIIALDDYFIGILKSDWHLHIPHPKIKQQFISKVSTYSDNRARKYISQSIVSNTKSYQELNDQAIHWLFAKDVEFEKVRIIPLSENWQDGFLALAQKTNSPILSPQCYDFIGKALNLIITKLHN